MWLEIAIYKVFWPPDKMIQLGSKKKVALRDIDIDPPPVKPDPPKQDHLDF